MININDFISILKTNIDNIAYNYVKQEVEIVTRVPYCSITVCPYSVYEFNRLTNKLEEGEDHE